MGRLVDHQRPPSLALGGATPGDQRRRTSAAQPLLGELVAATALVAIAGIWLIAPPAPLSHSDGGIMLALVAAIGASRFWPIEIGRATRLYLASVPLYLLACLFDPPVAALATAAGMLTREIGTCRQCQNAPGTVASQVGRWTLLSLAASALAHAFGPAYLGYAALLAALALWLGDIASCPLAFGPLTGQRPLALMRRLLVQSSAGELMQYLIALLTLVLFRTGILITGVLWVDALSLLMILLTLALLYLCLRGAEDIEVTTATSRERIRTEG